MYKMSPGREFSDNMYVPMYNGFFLIFKKLCGIVVEGLNFEMQVIILNQQYSIYDVK